MHRRHLLPALMLALAAGAFASTPQETPRRPADRQGPARRPGGPLMDRADLRHRAEEAWHGGAFTRDYQRFIMDLAARERASHKDLEFGREMAAVVSGTQWVNLGPTNCSWAKNGGTTLNIVDSGRPRAIVVHPQDAATIYNATAGGGVWKTTNGGASWTPLTDGLGSLSVGALALDPNAPDTLYLGLGDPFDGTGVGVVKSTNGGASWGSPVAVADSTKTLALIVHPGNSSVLLAGTNKGLFRSADAGATWSAVTPATGISGDSWAWDIVWTGGNGFAASFSDRLGSYGNTGQVWTSADGGATWTKASGMTHSAGLYRISLASAPSNRQTVYALASKPLSGGAIETADAYKSSDGGRTWTAMNLASKEHSNGSAGGWQEIFAPSWAKTGSPGTVLGGQGFYNHAITVDPANASKLYLGGQLYTTFTPDGGATWTRISDWMAQSSTPYLHADAHAAAWGPDGALYMGSDGGIFKSTDRGSTWTDQLNKGLATHLVYSVGSSLANRDAIIGGFQDNATRIRSGATGTFNANIGGDGFGSHIHAKNASNMIGTIYQTRMFRSTDGGNTFTESNSGISEANSSNAPFFTKVYAFAGDSTGNTVFTFTNPKIYKSTDYGQNWSALGTSGFPANWIIRNMNVHAANGQVLGAVGAVGSGVTDPRVFLTSNGGSSWTQVGTWPSGTALSYVWIDSNNQNTVYVASASSSATATHLWKSTDFGATWAAIDGNGFPTGIPVNVIQNDPGDSNVLYAGTHLGVYKSANGGASWSRFGTGLPLVNVRDFYLAPDSSLMRCATFGRGFWEVQMGTAPETVNASITQPASDQTVASGTAVNFAGNATSTKSGVTFTYTWNFGDGGSATGATASHTFTNTGSTAVSRSVTFTATSSGGGSASAQRIITVNPAPSDQVTVAISPTSATLNTGGTQQFTATVTGTTNTAVTWSATGGTVSASGLYTAPATAGTYTVTATSQADTTRKASATVTVNAPTGGSEKIVNGGFEVGTSPWAGTTSDINAWTNQPAHSGTRCAWLCGNGASATETLYQQLSIPSTATSATLSFWLHIDSSETTSTTAYDKLTVQIRNSAGTVLKTLATYSNLNKAAGYQQRTFDLSAYKGQTIRVYFKGTEDYSKQTSFVIDDVSVMVK